MKKIHRAAGLLCTCMLVVIPMPVDALELSGGVGLGGIVVGVRPRLAVSPNADVSWQTKGGFLVIAHDLCSIMPATDTLGVGIYNQTVAAIGYESETRNFSVGPSFSIYSMPACGAKLCGRVAGLSPGGHAQVNLYLFGPLGVSVNGNVDWVGGRSLVLPGGVVAMIVAGPVFRLRSK